MPSPNLKLENQVCHSLYSASNAMVRTYRPLLDELDLTYPQYLVMMALWEKDSVAIKDLVLRTRFDAGTLTPILKRLQSKEIIDLDKSEQDSRKKFVKVTEKGWRLAEQAESVPVAMACQIDMTEDEARLLKQLSEKLYHCLLED